MPPRFTLARRGGNLTALLVHVVIAVACAGTTATGAVRYGLPALNHWRHDRCLVRIEQLERELGILPPLPAVREIGTPEAKRPTRQQGRRKRWYY